MSGVTDLTAADAPENSDQILFDAQKMVNAHIDRIAAMEGKPGAPCKMLSKNQELTSKSNDVNAHRSEYELARKTLVCRHKNEMVALKMQHEEEIKALESLHAAKIDGAERAKKKARLEMEIETLDSVFEFYTIEKKYSVVGGISFLDRELADQICELLEKFYTSRDRLFENITLEKMCEVTIDTETYDPLNIMAGIKRFIVDAVQPSFGIVATIQSGCGCFKNYYANCQNWIHAANFASQIKPILIAQGHRLIDISVDSGNMNDRKCSTEHAIKFTTEYGMKKAATCHKK